MCCCACIRVADDLLLLVLTDHIISYLHWIVTVFVNHKSAQARLIGIGHWVVTLVGHVQLIGGRWLYCPGQRQTDCADRRAPSESTWGATEKRKGKKVISPCQILEKKREKKENTQNDSIIEKHMFGVSILRCQCLE